MGLLEKAGQIEGEKTSSEKPKIAEPESAKAAPEPVSQPEPVKIKKEKRSLWASNSDRHTCADTDAVKMAPKSEKKPPTSIIPGDDAFE